MEKDLVRKVTIHGFSETSDVYLVNNSYYSIEYRGKEVYYTKDKQLSGIVGNIVLFFYKNLSIGSNILAKPTTDEEKWPEFIAFLNQESKGDQVGIDLCRAIYESIEANYYEILDNKVEDPKTHSQKTSIRNKDNLMEVIYRIASLKNPKEADKNLGRYKRVRNEFVSSNPKLNLNIL